MEKVKEKLEELKNYHKQISAEVIAVEGAIQVLKDLLKEQPVESATVISPPDPKKEEK